MLMSHKDKRNTPTQGLGVGVKCIDLETGPELQCNQGHHQLKQLIEYTQQTTTKQTTTESSRNWNGVSHQYKERTTGELPGTCS